MPATGPRVRSWVFTINNPGDVDIPTKWQNVKAAVWQEEKGGEQETVHLQGVVNFGAAKTLAACKTLDGTAHWEPMEGTWQQAVDYCTKEKTRQRGPFRIGEKGKQGQRTDLKIVKKAIDRGRTEKELWDSCFPVMMRNYKAFREYRRVSSIPRSQMTETTVIYGPTGKGKTTWVEKHFPGA